MESKTKAFLFGLRFSSFLQVSVLLEQACSLLNELQ